MSLTLYRGLIWLLTPAIHLYLRRRLVKGREDPARFAERFGHAGAARPDGKLVWLHGASVGEAMSVLALIRRLRAERPDLGVMVTTGTVTSAHLLAERLPDGARHQYVPIDRDVCVRRFLGHWRPDLGIWIESEFWPNLMARAHARGVPMLLVNGRVSERSQAGWRWAPGLIRRLLGCFALALAQDEQQAVRLRALGAPNVRMVGNLKAAAAALPADEAVLAELRTAVGDRPVWLAASTHAGEEDVVADAHRRLRKRWPGLLTLLAPRHPVRANAVAALLAAEGLKVARRARGAPIAADTDIYLVDTLGELGLFYRLSEIAFVGGSLVPAGGHNPIEPAQLGSAVLLGPLTDNFAGVVAQMRAEDACQIVGDAAGLADAVAGLLSDPDARRRRIANAEKVANASHGILDAVWSELTPWLPPLPRTNQPAEPPAADARRAIA